MNSNFIRSIAGATALTAMVKGCSEPETLPPEATPYEDISYDSISCEAIHDVSTITDSKEIFELCDTIVKAATQACLLQAPDNPDCAQVEKMEYVHFICDDNVYISCDRVFGNVIIGPCEDMSDGRTEKDCTFNFSEQKQCSWTFDKIFECDQP